MKREQACVLGQPDVEGNVLVGILYTDEYALFYRDMRAYSTRKTTGVYPSLLCFMINLPVGASSGVAGAVGVGVGVSALLTPVYLSQSAARQRSRLWTH